VGVCVLASLNTFKAHSDKRYPKALLNRNSFSNLSELAQAPDRRPPPAHPWVKDSQSARTQCCGTAFCDPTCSSHHLETSGVRVGGPLDLETHYFGFATFRDAKVMGRQFLSSGENAPWYAHAVLE
jgi:hypothetical protein